MKDFIKSVVVLLLITCVSGALLGGVYEITKEPRAKLVLKAKNEAYKKVLSDADDFADAEYDKNALAKKLKECGFTEKSVIIGEVVIAKNNEAQTIGAIVTVTSKEGYGGDIQYTVGFKADGTISGLSILSISETAGLGGNASSDEFLNQFKNKKVEEFVVTKSGAKTDNEIDAISGATITTNAMVKGTNAAIVVFNFLEKTGGLEDGK